MTQETKLEYLEKFKDLIPFCIPCGDCWTHAPINPLREEMLPSPYLKCPALEKHGLISYALRGICAMADAVYYRDFPITPEVAERVYGCYGCGMCAELCWLREDAMPMIRAFRTQILENGLLPDNNKEILKGIRDRGHPWRGTEFTRTDWTKGLDITALSEKSDVDIVYWVGCTSALDDRGVRIAQSMGKVLKSAGINFGILGDEEGCCGEPAFWLGEAGLFEAQAVENIELLKKYKTKKIVTSCPHCFNVLKNEYPKFGSDFEVVHHTQYLADLIESGKVKVQKGLDKKITFHDPCFLGRHNEIYDPPRDIINSIHGVTLIEMVQNQKWAFCCGGGGGHAWVEDKGPGDRPNLIRTGQTIETGAEIVATACPFCLQQFDDGINTKGVQKSLSVADIAELLASAL